MGSFCFLKQFFFQWMYAASFHHLSHGQAISHDIVQVPAIIVKKKQSVRVFLELGQKLIFIAV